MAEVTGTSISLPKKRLLFVEDHADTSEAIRSWLERRGYEVISANTVRGGVELGEAEQFDLLVSDVGLPDGTGIDLLTALRAKKSFPAIAISGYGFAADVERCLGAGFNEHILKPFRVSDLERAIKHLLASTEVTTVV